jgi:DNA-binding response OmpR family regulator
VVVISADATERRVQELIEAGARDYLTKPLDVGRFLAVLDSLLWPQGSTKTTRRSG